MNKIHFFTKGDKSVASSRYRAYLLAEELNKKGFVADVYSTKIGTISFFGYLKLFNSFDRRDVIFLQRTIYNKYFFLAILYGKIVLGKKFIFDLDDAVFEHSFLKTFLLTKLASAVTCGSHFILDWAKKYNKNSVYFPNSIPLDIYLPFIKDFNKPNEVPIVGWIGDGPAHFENLKLLVPVFEKLINDGVAFKFRLIGALGDEKIYSLFNSVKDLQFEAVDRLDWQNPVNAAKEIQRFDIGIMPLVENDWSRAKYFKTLEYMACDVVPVVSGFGENKHIITDGVDGLLVSSEKDWFEKLKLLLVSERNRVEMGGRAIKTIKERFAIEKAASFLQNFLKQADS